MTDTKIPDRDPYAEELLVLHIVDTYRPTAKQPYITNEDIDEAMKPHPGPTPRSECSKYGWIRKPVINKKVRSDALELTDMGREMMGRRDFAERYLRSKIADEEQRARQFRRQEDQTNIPRLRSLLEWLTGKPAKQIDQPANLDPHPSLAAPKQAPAAKRRKPGPKPKAQPSTRPSVLSRPAAV